MGASHPCQRRVRHPINYIRNFATVCKGTKPWVELGFAKVGVSQAQGCNDTNDGVPPRPFMGAWLCSFLLCSRFPRGPGHSRFHMINWPPRGCIDGSPCRLRGGVRQLIPRRWNTVGSVLLGLHKLIGELCGSQAPPMIRVSRVGTEDAR